MPGVNPHMHKEIMQTAHRKDRAGIPSVCGNQTLKSSLHNNVLVLTSYKSLMSGIQPGAHSNIRYFLMLICIFSTQTTVTTTYNLKGPI